MRLWRPRQARHGAFKCDPTTKGPRLELFLLKQNNKAKQKPAQGSVLKVNRANDALVTSDSLKYWELCIREELGSLPFLKHRVP